MELSEEQKDLFLERIREGDNRHQAAQVAAECFDNEHITGTKFKFLCRRDSVFNRLYEEALLEGRGSLVERLENCAMEMAMNRHWPALRFLLTTLDEKYAWARSGKIEIGGTVQIQAVASILARYLPAEEYDELIKVVEQRMLEEGPPAVEAA